MRKNIWAALLISACTQVGAYAQNFDDFFTNKTLRVDYLFNGNAQKQEISLDELVSLPRWAGRRNFLDKLPLEGNGQITMKDKTTGKVIYRTSFSSLFQEWVSEEEASRMGKAPLKFESREAIASFVPLLANGAE